MKRNHKIVWLAVAAVVLLVAWRWAPSARNATPEGREDPEVSPDGQALREGPNKGNLGDELSVWAAAREYVEGKLLWPQTVEYGGRAGPGLPDVRRSGVAGYWRVTGWARAENAFGETVRMKFALCVKQAGDGGYRVMDAPLPSRIWQE